MGTHEYEDDPRNEDVLISVNGELFPRKEAKVSVFDSGFLLGDGVWESFRLHDGKLVFIEEHLDRLFHGASEISLDPGRTREEIKSEIHRVISVNEMLDHVHLRLIISRGLKPTPYQAPWVISSKPTKELTTIVSKIEHPIMSVTLRTYVPAIKPPMSSLVEV